jgi:biopolymer transport protein ExbD
MLNLFGGARKRKETPEINVVPILDMLMSVIFFLLLTTTFLQFTKQSVPPSSISKITDPVLPPPVTAKLIGVNRGNDIKLMLDWTGATPGHAEAKVTKDPTKPDESQKALLKATSDMINEFATKFPNEKTIQIGLGEDVNYQDLITIMDGSKDKLPDMVLFSYQEATLRAKRRE